jgi:hypothetical protein
MVHHQIQTLVSVPPWSPEAVAFLRSQLENVEVDKHVTEEFHHTSKELKGKEKEWDKWAHMAGFAWRRTSAIKQVNLRLAWSIVMIKKFITNFLIMMPYIIFSIPSPVPFSVPSSIPSSVPSSSVLMPSILDVLKWLTVTITTSHRRLAQKKIQVSYQEQENVGYPGQSQNEPRCKHDCRESHTGQFPSPVLMKLDQMNHSIWCDSDGIYNRIAGKKI